MSIASYLAAAPKVELHLHLEGAVPKATLLDLARRNRVELAPEVLAGLAPGFRYPSFEHFARAFVAVSSCLRSGADYQRAVADLGEELVRQNVRYAEVTTTPALLDLTGLAPEEYLGGLAAGRERARVEHGIELRWIFDVVRSIADPERSRRLADLTTALAIHGREAGVVALGLGGPEAGFPPEPFAPWFERARAAGLHCAPHAGECAGPESVQGAIDALGAERVGHGLRAIEDPRLLERLARQGVTLDLCPTSNWSLGVVATLAEHPLGRLRAAGVRVTVNSDDPLLFSTTLTDEVTVLHRDLGLGVEEIDDVLLSGVAASFLAEAEREALARSFRTEMAAARARWLP